MFGDLFGGIFGGGSRRSGGGPQKGANLYESIRITFDEAMKGVDKEIEITLKDECPTCKGSGAKPGTTPLTCPKCKGKGQVVYSQNTLFGMTRSVQVCPDCRGTGKLIKDKCPDCGGSGYKSNRKTLQVSVPAGIDDGQSIRLSGKGEPGVMGGPRGDLLVEIRVQDHPIFQREGTNIFSVAPMSYATAVLGGDVRISTIDGDVLYEVKPGTATDTRIRLRGKGVPSLRNKNNRGDHYVTLVVDVPTKLTNEQKELLKKFDDSLKGKTPDDGAKKKKRLF